MSDAEDDLKKAYDEQAGRIINLADWRATRFTGPPPPINWLVRPSIPLGVVVLLASMGGVGKSFLAAQLGFAVTTPPIEDPATDSGAAINLNYQWPILGGTVASHGKVAIITAEDNADVIHRRLAVIDPHERRTDDLIIVPLPSAGGPLVSTSINRRAMLARWHGDSRGDADRADGG